MWKVGDKIENRYEIHDIKMGGMGIVYLCYDHEFRAPVAIKTLKEKFLPDRESREKFTQEALIWVGLERHQNIVRAYYVKRITGQPYIFLECIVSGNLNDWMMNNRIDLPTALNFALQFSNGMEYANKKLGGIVHRDIKPGNIMITQDRMVKITDFGLLKAAGEKAKEVFSPPKRVRFIQSGARGTLLWMAPEQISLLREIDTRADIYSSGIVFYQMVTNGGYPYPISPSSTEKEMAMNHLEREPVPPSRINPNIPNELNSLILRCLEKKPENRFQSFTELKNELLNIYQKITGEKLVLEKDPEKLEVWELVNKGVSLYELGRPDEATVCYDKAIEINPEDAEAWNNKGASLGKLGRHDEAIACYDRALEINPEGALIWYNKGITLAELGRPDEAIVCYDKAIEINPEFAMAWNNKGAALAKLGRYDEAIACYDKAIEINPEDAMAWSNKGNALRELGRYDEAMVCLNRAIAINPEYAEAWGNKGNALFKLGRYDEAIECYDRAIEINPEDAMAWYNKGAALDELGKYDEAIECFDKAIEINPELAMAWNNKGAALAKLGRYDEAIACYDKAIEINPEYAMAWNNKGNALDGMGRYDEAIACYDKAIEINPEYAKAWNNKGIALDELGRPDEAIVCYNRAIEINPEDAITWISRGAVLYMLKRYDEAMKCADKALSINPNLKIAQDLKQVLLQKLRGL